MGGRGSSAGGGGGGGAGGSGRAQAVGEALASEYARASERTLQMASKPIAARIQAALPQERGWVASPVNTYRGQTWKVTSPGGNSETVWSDHFDRLGATVTRLKAADAKPKVAKVKQPEKQSVRGSWAAHQRQVARQERIDRERGYSLTDNGRTQLWDY